MAIEIRLFDANDNLLYEDKNRACIGLLATPTTLPPSWIYGEGRMNRGGGLYGWSAITEKDWSEEDLLDYFDCLRKSHFKQYLHPKLRPGNILFPLNREWNYAQHQIAITLVRDLGEHPKRVKGVLHFWRMKKGRKRQYSSNTSIILGWWKSGANTSHGIFPRNATHGLLPRLKKCLECKTDSQYASANFQKIKTSNVNFPSSALDSDITAYKYFMGRI